MKPVLSVISVFILSTSFFISSSFAQQLKEKVIYQSKVDQFKLYQGNDGDYHFYSQGRLFKIEAGINDALESSLKRLQGDLQFEYPKNHQQHYREVSKILLARLESSMRFTVPDDTALVKKSTELASQASKLNQHSQDQDPCADQIKGASGARKIGHYDYLDIKLDKESDKLLRQQIVKAKLSEDGFFDLGELKGINLSWDTQNDNFGHGLYHAVEGTKMYDEKPWFEGDDRGLTFGTAEGGTLLFEKGEIKVEHYSKAYTRIAPQERKYKINGREYTSYFSQDAEGKYYQEMLAVDGLLIELKRDVVGKKLYFKVKGQVEKVSDKGLAASLQKGWHELDKQNTIQYHNVSSPYKEQIIYSSEGAVGKTYERNVHDWLGVKALVEGRGGVSSELRDQSFVSLDTEIVVHSNSWKRNDDAKNKLPPTVEASLYAGKKHYFNGENYDRLGVRVKGNIAVSDSDVIGVYAGMGIEEDPRAKEMGSYEVQTRGRVDVTHFYGVNWTHYY